MTKDDYIMLQFDYTCYNTPKVTASLVEWDINNIKDINMCNNLSISSKHTFAMSAFSWEWTKASVL